MHHSAWGQKKIFEVDSFIGAVTVTHKQYSANLWNIQPWITIKYRYCTLRNLDSFMITSQIADIVNQFEWNILRLKNYTIRTECIDTSIANTFFGMQVWEFKVNSKIKIPMKSIKQQVLEFIKLIYHTEIPFYQL